MKTNKRSLIEALEARIAPAFSGSINLALLAGSSGNGPQGFRINGSLDNDNLGFTVADAGDVNGDGFNDLIVGAPEVQMNGNSVGAAYVIYGDDSGFSPTLSVDALDGTNGFRIEGLTPNARFGASVNGAGDVNGDGFGDLIVGAPLANTGAGATYVVFGKSTSFGEKFNLATVNGSNGFTLFGNQVAEFSGNSVSAAGDVNGDGYGDILIGAIGRDLVDNGNVTASDVGAAYVVYGHNGLFSQVVSLSLVGVAGAESGFRLDGVIAGDGSGGSVAAVGDFNGDGFGDFAVGASSSDSQGKSGVGRTYVVYGKANNFPATLSLGTIAGPAGPQIVGINAGDGLGGSVRSAGDVNGDGLADLIVGATNNDANGSNSGEAYVVYGRASAIVGSINAANAGIRIQGAGANDFAGSSVSGIGDFNGDGYGDLLVGVPGVAAQPGASYVVFGRPDGFSSPIKVNALDGTDGFKLPGLNIGDDQGAAVSAAGDVNGDGYADLIIGAPDGDHGVTDAGEAYVLFGSNGNNQVTIGPTGKTATYMDADGDLVTVRVNKGTLSESDFQLSGANYLRGATLQKIDFSNHTDLDGAKVRVSAAPQVVAGKMQGNGLVNIGFLQADGVNLAKVAVAGDIGRIVASEVKSLTVNSLGTQGLTTQAGIDASLISVIGSVSKLNVRTDIAGMTIGSAQLGKVRVGGDLQDSLLVLSGQSGASGQPALALKSLSVGGDLDHTQILGGASPFGGNADVAIGKVLVRGDWLASSLSAGVTAGNDLKLGTNDDQLYSGGDPAIASRIASVVIKGQALGTIEAGGSFAVTAENVGKVKVGKLTLALDTAAKDKLVAIGSTGDFVVNEV